MYLTRKKYYIKRLKKKNIWKAKKKEKEKLQKEIDALFNALADEEDW